MPSRDLSYYSADDLSKLKSVINGVQNAVYIPEKLNGDVSALGANRSTPTNNPVQKAAFIEKLQKEILEKGDCTPIDPLPSNPNSEVIKYVQFTYDDASTVASNLQAILNIVSGLLLYTHMKLSVCIIAIKNAECRSEAGRYRGETVQMPPCPRDLY